MRYDYDARGNVVRKEETVGEQKNARTTYEYDGHGRVTKITAPEKNETRFDYSGADFSKPTKVTDPAGAEFFYIYDQAGRNTEITTAYGTVQIQYTNSDGSRAPTTKTEEAKPFSTTERETAQGA